MQSPNGEIQTFLKVIANIIAPNNRFLFLKTYKLVYVKFQRSEIACLDILKMNQEKHIGPHVVFITDVVVKALQRNT